MAAEFDGLLALVQAGDTEALTARLKGKPALAEGRDDQGVSLLMHCLYHKRPDMVELVSEVKPGIDFWEAVSTGNTEVCTVFLKQRTNFAEEEAGDGFRATHLAAFFNQPATLEILLKAGADPSAVSGNPMEVCPLNCAAAAGANACAELLLEAGAEPDSAQHGEITALMGAAAGGNAALVGLLLEAGAAKALKSADGHTAAEFARERGHEDVAKSLA